MICNDESYELIPTYCNNMRHNPPYQLCTTRGHTVG